MAKHPWYCTCDKCNRRNFPLLYGNTGDSSSKKSGGTYHSTSFRSVPQRSDPSVTNHYFNGPGDGAEHGHVKEKRDADGNVSYPYIRDVEGNEYDRA